MLNFLKRPFMAIVDFPPVSSADESGLLAIGGDLEIESLLLAYSEGIFPWPVSKELPLTWFSPNPRGVIFCDKLRISRTMQKFLNKNPYEIKFNNNFEAVITECAKIPRKDQASTWITQEVLDAYKNMFQNKFAYSVEAYLDDSLVGGVYGICIGELFSGESMFHKEDNASKICLIQLVSLLHQKGIKILDTQMVTPVVKSMGGIEIPRDEFLKIIKKCNLNKSRELFLNS